MLKKIASYTAAAVIMSAALTSCGSTVQLGNTSEAPTSAAVTATAEENRAANQVEAVEKVITQAPAEEPVTESRVSCPRRRRLKSRCTPSVRSKRWAVMLKLL